MERFLDERGRLELGLELGYGTVHIYIYIGERGTLHVSRLDQNVRGVDSFIYLLR